MLESQCPVVEVVRNEHGVTTSNVVLNGVIINQFSDYYAAVTYVNGYADGYKQAEKDAKPNWDQEVKE